MPLRTERELRQHLSDKSKVSFIPWEGPPRPHARPVDGKAIVDLQLNNGAVMAAIVAADVNWTQYAPIHVTGYRLSAKIDKKDLL